MPGAPWLSQGKIEYIKALAAAGLSLNEISARTGTRKTTLYYHLRGICKMCAVFDGTTWNEWEWGYVVGLFIGDGNLAFVKRGYQYRIVFNFTRSRDGLIVERTLGLLRKAGLKPFTIAYPKKNITRIVCMSKRFFDCLSSVSVYCKKVKGRDVIQRKVGIRDQESWSKEFRLGFIGGLLDSDGYVNRKNGRIANVVYTTASLQLANQVGAILHVLNIHYSLYYGDGWRLRLSLPSFKAASAEINCVKGR